MTDHHVMLIHYHFRDIFHNTVQELIQKFFLGGGVRETRGANKHSFERKNIDTQCTHY